MGSLSKDFQVVLGKVVAQVDVGQHCTERLESAWGVGVLVERVSSLKQRVDLFSARGVLVVVVVVVQRLRSRGGRGL